MLHIREHVCLHGKKRDGRFACRCRGSRCSGFVLKALDTLLDPAIFFTRITGCVYGIGLLILFCALIDRRPLRRVCAFLRKTGEYSLELYMIHVGHKKSSKRAGVSNLRSSGIHVHHSCICGPVLCTSLFLSGTKGKIWKMLANDPLRMYHGIIKGK